jgi:hypothetical protein
MNSFKVYICQGPQHHVCEVASAFDGGCELCGYDIDEVEVVRVDEHPVLAVIQRAREDGYDLQLNDFPDGHGRTAEITLETVVGEMRSRVLVNGGLPCGASLDECARELLANWPEKT